MQLQQFTDPMQYQTWRELKLSGQSLALCPEIVKIKAPDRLTPEEFQLIYQQLTEHNYVVYESAQPRWSKEQLVSFGQQFGLKQFDSHLFGTEGVSDITVSSTEKQGEFIPYTRRRLGWHTDGYYNPNNHWVTSIILHCNSPAEEGGISRFVDPDLLYIYLYDLDPELINALMADDCLSIPAYDDGACHSRPASRGPVFWFNSNDQLQMRYTQRSTNIQWSDDVLLTKARALINDWLDSSASVMTHKLISGQGVLSNNVLHCRTAFNDHNSSNRHLLRARYLDSIHLTEDNYD